ncbi:MAG TPA: protein tyrosine phosphatase [Thermoproteota archaeon]|nr:protein tyrosine phosphatase [Thermoproteota archaeon]
MERTKVLFICSGNIDRSPTAEGMFKTRPDLEVKSAGTSLLARRRVTKQLIEWADKIFVMEQKHADRLESLEPGATAKIVVLNIPDEYHRNDPELIRLLDERVTPCLQQSHDTE